MAKEPPQAIGSLRQNGTVTDNKIMAAVEAFLNDPMAPPFEFESGRVLDVARAVYADRQAREATALREATAVYRRTIVRTAVILAVPEAK